MNMESPGAEAASESRRYRFAEVEFDERSHELRVGGRVVALERKPLEVLRYLLLQAGKTVTKEQLAADCWPGRILSDSVLAKTLSRLRAALADDKQSIIKTVHGYGYRFVAPVQIETTQVVAPFRVAGAPPSPLQAAERRQLSVLFCDLVGSAQISRLIDSEDFSEMVLGFRQTAAQVIERHDGKIIPSLGNGLLAYFGHPVAQDDDVERAVRAGHDILAAVRQLNEMKPGSPTLPVSVGVHTGSVVIGQALAGNIESLAVGDTTQIAAELQALAEPGALLVSDASLQLVPGLFESEAQAGAVLRGRKKRLGIYRITRPTGRHSRLEAAIQLTPLIGRSEELGKLSELWQQTQAGRGQSLLVTGEAGIGKSRLLLALKESIAGMPHRWLEGRASRLTRNSAFHTAIDLMQRSLAFKDGDDGDARLSKLEQGVDVIGVSREDAVPLLSALMNLKLPEHYAPLVLGPEFRRKLTLDLLMRWTMTLARHQPLVLVFEDLHWADPSTLDLLGVFLERLREHPVLLLMTARPEFDGPWPAAHAPHRLSLQPLRGAESGQMLGQLTGRRDLPAPVEDRIIRHAGGVPLFLEEIVKMLFASEQIVEKDGQLRMTGEVDDLAIPATLQDSLMARLDAMGAAKRLVQLCAVVGRDIPYRLLQTVAPQPEERLQSQLKSLTDLQVLYVRGAPPNAVYHFRHALIQDCAYDSLLKSSRQRLHRDIAQALLEKFPQDASTEPEILANHYEKSGQSALAVPHYQRAAEGAVKRMANREAISYAEHALSLLPALATEERQRRELQLTLILCNCRSVLQGYGHPNVQSAVTRVQALLANSDDADLMVNALSYLWSFNHMRLQFEHAIEFSRKLVKLGEKTRRTVIGSAGHAWTGWSYLITGRLAEAEDAIAEALRLYDARESKAFVAATNRDPTTSALVASAWTRWYRGYPDQALAQARKAVAHAQAVSNPFVSCIAASVGMTEIPLLRREPQAVLEATRVAGALAERHGFVEWQAYAARHEALAHCMLGQLDKGLVKLGEILERQRAAGALLTLASDYGHHAEQYIAAGCFGEAHHQIDEALEMIEQFGVGLYEAELHRIKGELLLAQGAPEASRKARDCFHKALQLSRAQGAKSLELRAATRLAQLLATLGRPAEARELLAPVCQWFTEGFETPDFLAAQALLEGLSAEKST